MQLSVSEVIWRIKNRLYTNGVARLRARRHASDMLHCETSVPFAICQELAPLNQPEPGWEQIKAPDNPDALLPDNQIVRITKPYFFEPNHGYMVDLDTRRYLRESLRYDTWMCLQNNAWKYPLIYFGSPLREFSSVQVQRVPLAISLAHAFPENYYHFVHDVIARISVILPFMSPECVVILPAGSTDMPFAKELLAHPGLSDIKFVDPKYTHIIADETILLIGGTPQRSDWLAMQARLVPNGQAKDRRKCLFVIRGKRPNGSYYDRSVLNEIDVVSRLQESDIDTISFAGMPVSMQMELINGYEHVISAHGAALTNICWVRNESFVLTEIHMADRKIDCYKSIASNMGWNYTPLIEGTSFRRRGTTLYNVDAQHVLDAAQSRASHG
jgi:hypothetical protein